MKKLMGLLAALCILFPAGPGFSQEASSDPGDATDIVTGVILSIDTPADVIVIRKIDDTEVALSVDPRVIGLFKEGYYVRAKVTAGTTSAESIHRLVAGRKGRLVEVAPTE